MSSVNEAKKICQTGCSTPCLLKIKKNKLTNKIAVLEQVKLGVMPLLHGALGIVKVVTAAKLKKMSTEKGAVLLDGENVKYAGYIQETTVT